ncbi:MAG: DUF4197 domain-containing protein [Bacteroidota bacterium]
MKRVFAILLILPLYFSLSAQGLKGLLDKAEDKLKGGTGLSQEEVGKGLKEALDKGVGKAVDFLSAEDGYYKSPYKILIPEEAQKVTSKLKAVPGFKDVESNLEEKLNRAAEDAAKKAKPIFVSAIKQMTFKDAMNLLMGDQDAATRYLEKSTYDNLVGEFMPVIQASLDKVNARDYWRSAVKAHNKLPFVKKANPELDEYVTQRALLGMFSLIEKKELDIRENTGARSSDLLKKVFAKQD